MTYDVKRIRAQYPALSGSTVFLDGAAGTQSPEEVIDAIAGAYRIGVKREPDDDTGYSTVLPDAKIAKYHLAAQTSFA